MIRNFKPERWPAGAPQKFDSAGKPGPEHGGYHDIDSCPSLSYLIEHRDELAVADYFNWAVGHRPAYELFDIKNDPGCLRNLASEPDRAAISSDLTKRLTQFLKRTGDPRLNGNGDIWEEYIRYSRMRSFPKPDWAK